MVDTTADPLATYRHRAFPTTIHVTLGVVLLVAAVMKGLEATRGALQPISLLAVLGECVLASWLLYRRRAQAANTFALAVFLIFAGVSLHKGYLGRTSCGCFGSAEVNPWFTASFDLMAVIGLWLCGREVAGSVARRSRLGALVNPLAAFALIVQGLVLISLSLASLPLPSSRPFALLEPEKWRDRPFPLIADIESSAKLHKGRWTALLYHFDCPDCRVALAELKSSAAQPLEADTLGRVMLIEVPPYAPAGQPPELLPEWVHARLRDDRQWIVQTPVRVQLVDGHVQDVRHP